MNIFWNILKITTFGESHGPALWVVIDGFPAGFEVDLDYIRKELDRRKPGQSKITTQRKEWDEFEIVSWIFEWKTTWHPITMIVYNKDQKSKDYSNIKDLFRPNHADLTYHQKYGIRDYRWGGRSSWRETVARVLAGALAKQFLEKKFWTKIFAYTKQIWDIIAKDIDLNEIEQNIVRTADKNVAKQMEDLIMKTRWEGDSIWWIIECIVKNPLKNLWEPVFMKIKAQLASAMLSIGWVLGFEYGPWFDVVNYKGSTYNDGFKKDENGNIVSNYNRYGWILWWITTGEDIIFKIAVKPTSSIYKVQKTVDINGNEVDFQVHGRHDPCIVPRVVPVVESMAALVLLDLYLMDKGKRMN